MKHTTDNSTLKTTSNMKKQNKEQNNKKQTI